MDLRQQLQASLDSAYTIERELGGGGMSRVFLAEERRLNRRVVIKLLSPELAASVSAERFEREIQLAASLQQANIVPILSAGRSRDLPFYTMPFVEGESLRARLSDTGALPPALVISVLRDVAKALAYAHERGVVHRDIKPDNVLLSGGTAVVTDFGIAKAISAARAGPDGATLTQIGTSIGTPAYMSPEQAAGDPAVDPRSDIYSLGCMAFELLTGQPPFHARTPARVLAAHLSEQPPDLGTLRPELPAGLAELVMRCLAKEPAGRPQSGQEVIQGLDAVSSPTATLATGRSLAPARLGRGLALYGVIFLAVILLARMAVFELGFPEWVWWGALAVMLLGLPLILIAGLVERAAHRHSIATPAATPGDSPTRPAGLAGLAVRASPHLTWRRAWVGGAAALGGFVFVVAAIMVLRLFGIGPAGSLLAAGRLAERERLLVTEFQSADTSLSTLVTEAVRTNLGQSRVISLMPPAAITAALARMQRPADSRLDLALAREIAQREGIKAIVDGSVRTIGGDYVISLALISADSGHSLAAYQETARGSRELLAQIDRITRKLRGKIGESLREVQGSPRLEQVTTPSLDALRIYAEAARDIDRGGSPLAAAERLREAVRLDPQFAMAWRKLGVALSNASLPRVRVDSALEMAYRFRDRLTERERLLAEGTYFQLGPGRDRRRAIEAYERLLDLDPTESGAANNLASILMGRRQFARAESLFRTQIDAGRATSQQYTNLINVLMNAGKTAEAETLVAELRQHFPEAPTATLAPMMFFYERGQFDSLRAYAEQLSRSDNIILRINGIGALANYSLYRGRVEDMLRYGTQAQQLQGRLGQPLVPFNDSLQISFVDLGLYEDTVSAIARVERNLARTDLRALPFDSRPYLGLASFFAAVGDPARARSFVARFDAELPDSSMIRIRAAGRNGVLGAIALAERRFDDAIRLIWQADTTYDGPSGNCVVCVLDDVGAAYYLAGQTDSAIVYFERYLEGPAMNRHNMDAGSKPLMLKRLGELYEQKGDKVRAARYYRQFIDLWERADSRLQPKVEDARARLRRLADPEG